MRRALFVILMSSIGFQSVLARPISGEPGLRAGGSARITILVDAISDRSDVRMDWGYAALVEYGELRILFDTGNDSELFRHNFETLKIDLARLDFVVISHRHGDHTDGLRYLLSRNPDVPVLAPDDEYFGGPTPRAFFARPAAALPRKMRYFGGRVPEIVPHGSPWKHARIERIATARELAPGVKVVSNTAASGPFTQTPELSLVLDTPGGEIIVVGCSHPGIDRILESLGGGGGEGRAIVGGLHWVSFDEPEVERIAALLRDAFRVETIAPGHCTGEIGFSVLSRIFGERYVYAGVGTSIELGHVEPNFLKSITESTCD
jgi:7,8-dihydropterin-6-yl-methyl-4-(beta-D-ribofuranosyl)aminobenzene 5'-phosphate synthase